MADKDAKKGRKDKKLSMHPLGLEEALGAALEVKVSPTKKRRSGKKKRPNEP